MRSRNRTRPLHINTRLFKLQYSAVTMSFRFPQPAGRDRHAAVAIGQKLYVWGGDGGDARIQTSRLESFDVISTSWQRPQQLTGDYPNTLWDMAVTTDGKNAYTFGGWTWSPGAISGLDKCGRLYKIDPSALEVKELVPGYPSRTPSKTSSSDLIHFDNKLVLFGKLTDQDRVESLHVFDLTAGECEGNCTLVKLTGTICEVQNQIHRTYYCCYGQHSN